MRNMHVPAYWPALLGVQALEYSGVWIEVKNTIAIELIPINGVEEDMSMAPPVELLIDVPDIVGLGAPDMDILDMSIV